ncbi:hypothetical protein AYO44_09630 [Planctomycetaceae bacterium SCGC AG-212-F19]|nr:hypothetical protein AYO44_09630 [Planctomycetaceae bacterium SCGC AG-212-F19]
MSTPAEPQASPSWPVLSMNERRVLGVLVEKAKTTPEVYPLTVNALVTGCNQKSNREPLMHLTDGEVEDTLTSCQKKGLTVKITGGRAERWRHTLYDTWHVRNVDLAILAELLLRGAQTEGELRGRASRMEPIADLDALRAVLRPLAERRLVVFLGEEGRRGTLITHGFQSPQDVDRLRATHSAATVSDDAPPTASAPARSERVDQIAELRAEMAQLQATVADLAERVKALEERLGAKPPTS